MKSAGQKEAACTDCFIIPLCTNKCATTSATPDGKGEIAVHWEGLRLDVYS